jgi:hypothetical protein
VLNGADDRRELYELERPEARDAIARSVAALMWSHRIDYANPASLRAVAAGEVLGLCGDERFVEQPAAAFCSGTLIDDDLLLTAGHCFGADLQQATDRCKRTLVVFDYHYRAAGALALASADSIYSCRRIAYHDHTYGDETFSDVAIFQLDRKVSARSPVKITSAPPQTEQSLLAATHGVGLPLKVDTGGKIVDVPSDAYFQASTDSFEGGSGGPVFDDAMALLGYQTRGAADWDVNEGCSRAAYARSPVEEHQLADRAVRALCARGWPSETLCGQAPACGDGVCSGTETPSTCGADCPAARCGDGWCEASERADCARDCSAYAQVPARWMVDPANYHSDEAEPSVDLAGGGCRLERSRVQSSTWVGVAWLAALITLVVGRRR